MQCPLADIETVWKQCSDQPDCTGRCRQGAVPGDRDHRRRIEARWRRASGGCRSRSRRRASTMRPTPPPAIGSPRTRKPGMHNLGNYRGMVKAEDRIGVLLGRLNWGMRWHIDRWRDRGAHARAGSDRHRRAAARDLHGGDAHPERHVRIRRCGRPGPAAGRGRALRHPGSAGAGRRRDRHRGHGADRCRRDGGRIRRVPRLHGAARLQLLHGRDRDHDAQASRSTSRS